MQTHSEVLGSGTQCSHNTASVHQFNITIFKWETGWKRLSNITQREADSKLESFLGSTLCALFCFSAFPEIIGTMTS